MSESATSRDEIVALVVRAHLGSAPGSSAAAAETLSAASKLPKRVAENLGAGLGQWDFFPEIEEIVDFAIGYVPPTNEEELWALARTWASDDAASRKTILSLVGRDILHHELQRIDVPKLRELIDEKRPMRERELRVSLGLDVPTPRAKPAPRAERPAASKAAPGTPTIPKRMPMPEKRAPKAAAVVEIKRFHHPKFGEGVLEAHDGTGPDAKLTIKFAAGAKTLLAKYVTEIPS